MAKNEGTRPHNGNAGRVHSDQVVTPPILPRPPLADQSSVRHENAEMVLERVVTAFNVVGADLRPHSRGYFTGLCPLCGGGRSRRGSLRIAVGNFGTSVAVTCYRCGGLDRAVWKDKLGEILSAANLSLHDLYPRSTARGPVGARQEVCFIFTWMELALAAVTKRGLGGDSRRRVIWALASIAAGVGSRKFTASERQIAEVAGVSRVTVNRVLQGRRNRRGESKSGGLAWVPGKPEARWVDRERPPVVARNEEGKWYAGASTLALVIPVQGCGKRSMEEPLLDRAFMRSGSGTLIFGLEDSGDGNALRHAIAAGVGPGSDLARGLGGSVWRTLRFLRGVGRTAVKDVAAALELDRRTAAGHLTKLEKHGLARLAVAGGRGRGRSPIYEPLDVLSLIHI